MPGTTQIILNKVYSLEAVLEQVEQWKSGGKKIIFTNGVFDLIHPGHITYLAKASELGDKLIIGLNADNSVKRLKGEGRPVNQQEARALLLASFFFVDAVVMFDEDTPLQIISKILPSILVKGSDYAVENIVGAKEVIANGGTVQTIDFLDGFSSTAIINRIKN